MFINIKNSSRPVFVVAHTTHGEIHTWHIFTYYYVYVARTRASVRVFMLLKTFHYQSVRAPTVTTATSKAAGGGWLLNSVTAAVKIAFTIILRYLCCPIYT